jgi:hypothetical protein
MQLKAGSANAVAWAAFVLGLVGIARGQQVPASAGDIETARVRTEASAAAEPRAVEPPSSVVTHAAIDAAAYADSDHVFVLTPSLSGAVSDPLAGWSVGGQYLVDIVSAASVDIVSTASRNWVEVRHAGALDISYKPAAFGVALDAAVSSEPDYLSWTIGGTLSHDLLDDNLTLLLGFGHGHDIAGRAGTSFSVFSRPLDREHITAGLSVVLDAATIGSVLADVVIENGDSSKPYRYVPLFAPGTAVPNGASISEVTRLRVSARPLEQLPRTRERYALSLRLAHRFSSSTLRADERLYADSWHLMASSTDVRYLIDLGRRWELGPHGRIHIQTPVNFWQRAYVLRPGFDYPALRTGDRELGPLLGLTLGWTTRWGIGPAGEPDAWRLGLDVNATETRYFDDLYLSERLSVLAMLSLEATL